ncbi:MAG TPA: MMPL family transporter, partial [Bacteroidia bacterium]|nr:MMPL family transporter [Bacteroidia bacterium]
VGFLSLLFSSIQPIRDFGIYTSVGIVIAFILSYTLLPALLFFFTPKKLVSVHGHDNNTYNVMRKMLFWIFRNQKTIVAITVLLIITSVAGIYKIKVNNLLLDDLSNGVKIKQDFNFFDKEYSGVRPLEIQITVKDTGKNVWDYSIIKQLNGLDEFIKKEYGAGFLYSPASLVKSLNKALNDNAGLTLPNQEDFETITKELKNNKKNKDIKRLVSADFKTARISAKIQDVGSSIVKEHNQK